MNDNTFIKLNFNKYIYTIYIYIYIYIFSFYYIIVFTRTVFKTHYSFLFCTVTDEGLRPKLSFFYFLAFLSPEVVHP